MVLDEVIRAWRGQHPEDELAVVVPHRDRDRARAEHPGVEVHATRAPLHPVLASVVAPRIAGRIGADLVVTQNFAPLGRRTRSAVFVHDVLFQTNASWFTRTERAYLALVPLLLTRAHRVLTSSRSEAARIRSRNPRVREVVAAGLGIASALRHDAPARPVDGLVSGRFLLTVGRLNVRKNLSTTVEAAVASGRLSRDQPLVVVGEPSGRPEVLSGTARAAEASGTVRYLGGVPDDQLRWLYEHCRLMLFLSRDEGWGLPPVEAANLGAPVLVSDRPVFHETLDQDATFVDPDDVAAVTACLRRELDRADRHRPPSDTARQRSSWTGIVAAARETTEV
ncbi:glycosyltransferase family 4 protein [Curtobacterium luteum]|uniref:glycosyltransferase family 4 protein n=1 Tax=Curtobacterium luteum TaxID=33881 RepID=UPI0038074E5A